MAEVVAEGGRRRKWRWGWGGGRGGGTSEGNGGGSTGRCGLRFREPPPHFLPTED